MRTASEILFERLCGEVGIPIQRISETDTSTPDYEITLSGTPVLVEVKQLEPNEIKKMIATLRAGKVAARSVDMGRARLPIKEAVNQLRPHAKGKKPAIVVLYDTIGMTGYLDPYSISFSLYGPEKAHFDVPHDPREEVVYRGMSRGGKSIATKQHNTTLSAVGVLRGHASSAVELAIFHNIHATMPLEPALCHAAGLRQFHFLPRVEGTMPEWVEWKPDDGG